MKEKLLNEYEKCKEMYEKSRNYEDIADSDFSKEVRLMAIRLQTDIYNYISKNLKMDGKKIEMPMKKNEFVYDLFKRVNKRR